MALRDQPYIPLYVMDFLSDEKLANCSAESTGVYIRLMCIMHKMTEYGVITLREKEKQNESNITNFAFKLVRQMPYDVVCIERSLLELVEEEVLTLDGDRLFQKRMVRDGQLSKKRAEAGKKGGKSPKNAVSGSKNTKQNTKQNGSKPKSKSEANSENEYEIENEYENDIEDVIENDKKSNASSNHSKLIEERFDAFWKAYPKKSGKGAAKKAFQRIAPAKELFEKIMTALDRAKVCDQWLKDGGQYIPNPATWLNQERWEDEYPATGTQRPPRTAPGGKPDTLGILESMLEEGDEPF